MTVLNLFSFMCTKQKDLINDEIYEDKNWAIVMNFLEESKNNDFFIGWGSSFDVDASIMNEIRDKKREIEKFFKKTKIKENVFCFRSRNGKRALHPSRYLEFKDIWIYDTYFKQ